MTGELKFKILLIDDDIDLLATLGDFLRFRGYDVITASSGELGLQALATMMPDLIILDISMPGIGGIGLMRKLGLNGSLTDVPIYIFTARSNMKEYFADMDIAGFMAKPCDPEVLFKAIQAVLAHKRPISAGKIPESSRKKMLLVENDIKLQTKIVKIFSAAGYQVLVVDNGVDVLEKTILEKPAIVLMRLILADINGDRIAALIDEIPSIRGTPVILYAGTISTLRDQMLQKFGKGVSRFVDSDNPNELLKCVQQLFAH